MVVVGSINCDLTTYCDSFPSPGETLTGASFSRGFGGKGGNQAAMSGRLANDMSQVAMVGCVGDDSLGTEAKESLANEFNVDTSCVKVIPDMSTGVASITVDSTGENMIIVVPGANACLTPERVFDSESTIKRAKVVVCQLEVPVESTLAALSIGKQNGCITILNPAPATELPDSMFPLVDILVPNQTELAQLSGGISDPISASTELLRLGAKCVVVTMGAEGALIVQDSGAIRVPGVHVKKENIKDTCGAGDCFVGTLSYMLAIGESLEEAVSAACKVAARSIQETGAQSSYPKSVNF